ncbi:DUF6817 domain-containing protein [Rhizohabitans arisaemae]|uniref:DUF6817 domain-containing protein n=1 Tax=Rhizohabitans arisaemae TaxID=2720610 RepID=UPI0024B14E00|nr:hypothetical protein [Rhizohabitans arisaemae]
MISEIAVALLRTCGADRVPHSGRTLLDHLTGTARILDSWAEPDWVVHGGLLHSVYGSPAGGRPLLTPGARPVVRSVVGPSAETLAYAFAHRAPGAFPVPDSPELRLGDGSTLTVDAPLRHALADVYAANLLEQLPRLGLAHLADARPTLRSLTPFLSPAARARCSPALPPGWLA